MFLIYSCLFRLLYWSASGITLALRLSAVHNSGSKNVIDLLRLRAFTHFQETSKTHEFGNFNAEMLKRNEVSFLLQKSTQSPQESVTLPHWPQSETSIALALLQWLHINFKWQWLFLKWMCCKNLGTYLLRSVVPSKTKLRCPVLLTDCDCQGTCICYL